MRTLIVAGVAGVAGAALLTGCGSSDEPTATTTTTPSTVVQTVTATPTPTATSTAAAEQAFVLEVGGQIPETLLTRAELVKAGHTTCKAFREKPGSVATLVKNAQAAGASAEQVELARVIAIAAIHNLCTDQAGDL